MLIDTLVQVRAVLFVDRPQRNKCEAKENKQADKSDAHACNKRDRCGVAC